MKISTIELRKITADEDMVLTNGETYSSVGGSVFLGINDNPKNWNEITKQEYESIIAENQKDMESEEETI